MLPGPSRGARPGARVHKSAAGQGSVSAPGNRESWATRGAAGAGGWLILAARLPLELGWATASAPPSLPSNHGKASVAARLCSGPLRFANLPTKRGSHALRAAARWARLELAPFGVEPAFLSAGGPSARSWRTSSERSVLRLGPSLLFICSAIPTRASRRSVRETLRKLCQ